MTLNHYTVNIGSNIFFNTPCALGYKEGNKIIPFLQAKIRSSDNSLQFSFDAFDENGNKFHIRNNIPVGINNEKIEIIHEANKKIVKDIKSDKIILDIRKSGNIEIYGDFYFNGTHIQSDENSLIIGGLTLARNKFKDCGGILLDKSSTSLGFNGIIPDLENI